MRRIGVLVRTVPHQRITLKTLAGRLGVSHTTISLALRNHPSISPETKRRVMNLARELNYSPDPMLSSLVAYRINNRPRSFQGMLGWLTNFPDHDGWRIGQLAGYHAGAARRAQELGYGLADFWLREPGLSPVRLRQIMLARNVQGLILPPQPEPHTRIDFQWDDFAAVSLGYSLAEPKLHLVMNHQFLNMGALVRKLVSLEYRSIGLAMPASRDDRVEHNYLAGYLMGLHVAPKIRALPPLIPNQLSAGEFLAWHQQHRPEVIITEAGCATRFLEWLEADAEKGPDRVGLALVNCPYGETHYSGINENPELVGATAVDVVVGMLHSNEFGIPKNARHVLIQGTWHQGRTTRPEATVPMAVKT